MAPRYLSNSGTRTISASRTDTTERGFTIMELMIALLIIGVISALAGPSFVNMVNKNRVVGVTNNLVSTIQLARSHSVNKGVVTAVGPSTSDSGWLLYEDASETVGGSLYDAANDTLIRRFENLPETINIDSDVDGLSFKTNGMLNANSTATFHICNNNDASEGRRLTVDRGGRAFVDDIPTDQTCEVPEAEE